MVPARYHLHDVPLVARADRPGVARVLDEALRYKTARSATDAPDTEAAQAAPGLTLTFTAEGAVTPPPGMHRAGVTDFGVALSFDGEAYLLEGQHGAALVEPARGRATGVLPPALLPADEAWEARPAPEAYALVVLSLTLLLRARGLPSLHAAALARDGHGVLVSAPSGHGKSTTAFNLLRSGWTPVSDDAVLLRATGGPVEALTFRRAFCIRPAAVAQFPELAPPPDLGGAWPPALTDADKWRVDVERVYGRPAADRCVPALLLLPAITGAARTRVAPASPKEVFFALLEQSVMSVPAPPETARAQMDLVKALVGQVETVRLLAGRDLLDEPNRAAELIGDLFASQVGLL